MFAKHKHTGKRQDIVTASEYQALHKGKEKDLQKAVEKLCGLYGWIRLGTLGHLGDKPPLNCPGFFWHIPDAAFYISPGVGDPELIANNIANMPDVMLWRKDGKLRGLELKRNTGKRSRGQKEVALFIEDVHLVKSSEHAEELIKEFAL